MIASVKYGLVFALIACMMLPAVSALNDVTITVVDKHGDPIEDADVLVVNSTDDEFCDDTTDDDGLVDCDDLTDMPDEDYTITVTHDDYQTFVDDESFEDLDSDIELVIVMRPKKVDLTVTVVDNDGDEVKNADVNVQSLDEDRDDEDFDDYDPDDYDFSFMDDDGDISNDYPGFPLDNDEDTDDSGEAEFPNIESDTEYNITVTKSGFMTVWVTINIGLNDNEDIEIELTQPGDATFTAIVRDQESNAVLSGVNVKVKSRSTGEEATAKTGNDGTAEFTLDTPDCYDIAVTMEKYSSDSQTNICLDNDDDVTSPFYISSQNNAPTADAGQGASIMLGDEVALDGSGSADPDGDDMTYVWEDSLGMDIPDEVSPTVVFDIGGVHVLTLTVSDGEFTDTDTVEVTVETPANCGDGVCSIIENDSGTCPEDCPICFDAICGAGEADASQQDFYCPVDCGISPTIRVANAERLVEGNMSVITVVDPTTNEVKVGARVRITLPNGTVVEPRTLAGRTEVTFPVKGTYGISVSLDRYPDVTTTVTVDALPDTGWVIWLIIIVILIIAIPIIIRILNLYVFGKRGKKGGYRAMKYRRTTPTLRSI